MSTGNPILGEAYKDHPLHLEHIIPLDFDSISSVPDSHVWSKSDDGSHRLDADNYPLPIPVIDLKNPEASNLIGHACETLGLFQVTNHGIPLSLLKEVENEARRFFSLPSQQKLKTLRSPTGATGYGNPRIAPFFNKHMWYEGFTIMGSPIDHAKELWPHDYLRFCDVMEEYQKEMKELATTLMSQILKFLNIPETESTNIRAEAGGALQLNYYPPSPNPDQTMGLAPHTDTSLFTILHLSSINGLQIFKGGVGWVPVSPTRGALVINIGDLLDILSNARFPSILHRVAVRETTQRVSVAYFYCLPPHVILSPLAASNSGHVPRYRSVSTGDYIGIKAKNLEQALSLIKM